MEVIISSSRVGVIWFWPWVLKTDLPCRGNIFYPEEPWFIIFPLQVKKNLIFAVAAMWNGQEMWWIRCWVYPLPNRWKLRLSTENRIDWLLSRLSSGYRIHWPDRISLLTCQLPTIWWYRISWLLFLRKNVPVKRWIYWSIILIPLLGLLSREAEEVWPTMLYIAW